MPVPQSSCDHTRFGCCFGFWRTCPTYLIQLRCPHNDWYQNSASTYCLHITGYLLALPSQSLHSSLFFKIASLYKKKYLKSLNYIFSLTRIANSLNEYWDFICNLLPSVSILVATSGWFAFAPRIFSTFFLQSQTHIKSAIMDGAGKVGKIVQHRISSCSSLRFIMLKLRYTRWRITNWRTMLDHNDDVTHAQGGRGRCTSMRTCVYISA